MQKLLIIISLISNISMGFSQWNTQVSNTSNDLKNVSFVSEMQGWTVGRFGTLLATTDGGVTWMAQNSGTTKDLNDIYMVNSSLGYAVGNSGTILKYEAGSGWSTLNSGSTSIDIKCVHFLDENIGWAAGGAGRVFNTTDGGLNWTISMTPSSSTVTFNDIFMLSETEGWLVGTGADILRYNGTSWVDQPNTLSYTIELYGVYFSSPTNGFAVGKNSTIVHYNGSNWSEQNSGLGNVNDQIRNVHVINDNLAYAAVTAGFGGAGVILKYNGSVWTKDYETTGLDTEFFVGVCFPSANRGYSVGAGGLIKTKGSSSSAGIKEPSSNASLNIYPNPNNGKFILESNLDVRQISIYNVYGEKVLEFQQKEGSTNEIDLSGSPQGIYFINVNENDMLHSAKFIIQ